MEGRFGCKVDLVLESVIKPRLRPTILNEALHARDYKIYAEDILEATGKIRRYIENLVRQSFHGDEKTFDAVVRNVEGIGEAIKKIPDAIRTKYPGVEWKKIAGVRDILVHEYFGIDVDIIGDIIQHKLPALEKQVRDILAES